MNFGKTILVGRLTRDPEMRYVGESGDIAVTNFTIAVNEGFGENEKTHFVRIATWRKLAENCAEYLVKGQEVLVEGNVPTASAWVNGEGEPKAQVELTAYGVQFGAKPRSSE